MGQLLIIFFTAITLGRIIKWGLIVALVLAMFALEELVWDQLMFYLNAQLALEFFDTEFPLVEMMSYAGIFDFLKRVVGAYGVLVAYRVATKVVESL